MPHFFSDNLEDAGILFEKQKIVDYIEDRHLSDGGYFFAKIEPSSGLDTYLVVKTLNLLGVKVKHAKSIILFWEKEEGILDDFFGIFLAAETYKELGQLEKVSTKYKRRLIEYLKDSRGTIGRLFVFPSHKDLKLKNISLAMDYISTIGKDLRNLYYLTILSHDLKIKVDNKRIVDFTNSLHNKDGGFGHRRESHLMATYHALNILNSLSFPIKEKDKTTAFLTHWLDKSDYLEDLFYSVKSLALLGEPIPKVENIVQFIESCQRKNGGFSRARVMGIPTIEHTYMAVSVLKVCEKYAGKRFLKENYA